MGNKRLTNDEIAFFCEQLSLVINAGIPLSDGAEMISENAGGGRATAVAKELEKSLSAGKALANSSTCDTIGGHSREEKENRHVRHER